MPPSTTRNNTRRYRSDPSNLPQQKSIACRNCHARKIKCSGNKPCNNCSLASECVYPMRDRQIRVKQSFLDHLLQENEELRAQIHPESAQPRNPDGPSQPAPTSSNHQHVTEEKILEEIDWFAQTRTSDTPIWIGEISDAAFATRFRQFASSSQTPSHIPRTQFASDDDLRLLVSTSPSWPTPPRARLLVQTALKFLRYSYHVVRRSEVLSVLDVFCSDPGNAALGPVAKARMWALFALGELRSSKCLSSSKRLPGLAYFAIASDTVRLINERPQLDVIETTLILVGSLANHAPSSDG